MKAGMPSAVRSEIGTPDDDIPPKRCDIPPKRCAMRQSTTCCGGAVTGLLGTGNEMVRQETTAVNKDVPMLRPRR